MHNPVIRNLPCSSIDPINTQRTQIMITPTKFSKNFVSIKKVKKPSAKISEEENEREVVRYPQPPTAVARGLLMILNITPALARVIQIIQLLCSSRFSPHLAFQFHSKPINTGKNHTLIKAAADTKDQFSYNQFSTILRCHTGNISLLPSRNAVHITSIIRGNNRVALTNRNPTAQTNCSGSHLPSDPNRNCDLCVSSEKLNFSIMNAWFLAFSKSFNRSSSFLYCVFDIFSGTTILILSDCIFSTFSRIMLDVSFPVKLREKTHDILHGCSNIQLIKANQYSRFHEEKMLGELTAIINRS